VQKSRSTRSADSRPKNTFPPARGKLVSRLPQFFLTTIALLPAVQPASALAGACGNKKPQPYFAIITQTESTKGGHATKAKPAPPATTSGNSETANALATNVTSDAPATAATATRANTDSQVWLKWTPSANATGYNIRRSLNRDTGYKMIGSNVATEFVNTGLANGTEYFFTVAAQNATGESAPSAAISARPTAAATTNLTLATSNGELTISWPADHTGWLLQMQTIGRAAGLGTNWLNVTNSIATNLLRLPVILTNPGASVTAGHSPQSKKFSNLSEKAATQV
jgi:hypothetical protein